MRYPHVLGLVLFVVAGLILILSVLELEPVVIAAAQLSLFCSRGGGGEGIYSKGQGKDYFKELSVNN